METKPLSKRERIKELVLYLDIKIKQLAEIAGLNPNTLYHISDNSRFGISESTASKICYNVKKKLGVVVNRDWLLTGEGEMIVSPSPAKDVTMEPAQSEINWQDKYIALLEKHIELQREYTACLKKRMQ